jgi:hypothetical protein
MDLVLAQLQDDGVLWSFLWRIDIVLCGELSSLDIRWGLSM